MLAQVAGLTQVTGLGQFAGSAPLLALALIGGTAWGVLLGSLPGVTGLTAMVLAIPVALGMDPLPGIVLLIAIHAVTDTGGAVTAIAMGIPGTPSNAATVEDGHALARNGHLARAISAAAFASALGGIVGFGLLAATLPVSMSLV
ncbi:MAG: tripartite tricarboxylate transporter permease, partial [Paracoccaceae bacterium]|nr:tripartite tricarboxylate transporter permease [Paracoccaceae bacterium]